MAEHDTSRDIDEAASRWTARLDREPLTPEEEEAFRTWQAEDPRNKGALLRAQALLMLSESGRALGQTYDPAAFQPSRRLLRSGMSRRRALGVAAGAGIVASVAILGISMPAAGTVIRTERGEVRLVPLKDGSTVLLNTQTSVRITYDETMRLVTLLDGEAFFSVAPDDGRAFKVEVDHHQLQVTQAQFRVRKLGRAPVDLLVHQGEVTVATARGRERATGLRVGANSQLTLSADAGEGHADDRPRPIAAEAITRALAWREGKLAFEGESLAQAAEAFARYSDTRILIPDATLAREPVTGLFAANDPRGFGRAVSHVFGATLEQDGDRLVLTRVAAPR